MSDEHDLDPIDARLAELGGATEPIQARPGFADRVMLAAAREGSWQLELVRSARRWVPLAALAALMAVTWAVVSESSTDAAIAVVDDTELEW